MSQKLLAFVAEVTRCVENVQDEVIVVSRVRKAMSELVSTDDWLPETMALSDPKFYQQHLLYGDPLDRFSVVSFVWGPGQQTPVHDHSVWGVIGMLRGSEINQRYGRTAYGMDPIGGSERLEPGDVEIVSEAVGDIHQVRNAFDDRVSISIHCYGGNIGRIRRHVFKDLGETQEFVSGYSNALTPNLWAPAQ
ncbi:MULTISPECIES: cysteine dioxygenase [Bradyrhizobium]|uniref:Cysteine dioxygenase n=2 Tax=Bradyrhizobium TaxID=374 RepID=A0A9X1UI84_9BRAD|nr:MULTISPECIES: cysteine dioxygenase [Bradyrhizobium]MCG2629357.1 cysteine dioxygenase [Bradyrhizobium zhengyangense]MCG2644638.1 cysteine dioxygenase [Bradyrhizobium zhengyangense]MCG2670871.1 cysteine dioxygenase [Bradyrhizobium zhengyangense]MDN4984504.1 cysteine dioxygenase [Bradyrhizobium sp. WYCCWR 13022]MDN5002496.1 cysteine dioxygenase [Bradyrhizobium sp. WYCCWR 12677]